MEIERGLGLVDERRDVADVDRLVQVDGKDLTESVGEAIQESLFAKSGAKLTLTFVRDSAQKTAVMTLGKKK